MRTCFFKQGNNKHKSQGSCLGEGGIGRKRQEGKAGSNTGRIKGIHKGLVLSLGVVVVSQVCIFILYPY